MCFKSASSRMLLTGQDLLPLCFVSSLYLTWPHKTKIQDYLIMRNNVKKCLAQHMT